MQAQYNLAVTYAQLGDTDRGILELRKARELAKEDAVRKQIDDMIARLSGAGTQTANAGDAAALPEGHPPVDGPPQPAPPLPQGHPPVDGPGQPAPPLPQGHPPVDGQVQPAPPLNGPARSTAASAARTPFQTEVEKRFRATPIMGERITRVEWSGPGVGRVVVSDFPMAAMPTEIRDKFNGRLSDELKAAVQANAPAGDVKLEIADASGSVLATVTP
jgi:hypothetical protein